MDTVEGVREELEKCIKKINSLGKSAFDDQMSEQLGKLSAAAVGVGMPAAQKLVDNLSGVLKLFKEGKSGEDSVSVRVTALEFYLKKISSGAGEEEL